MFFEKIRVWKIQMILEIKNWHWKTDLHIFWPLCLFCHLKKMHHFLIVKFFDFIILYKQLSLFLQHLRQKAEAGWKNCERRVGSFIKREPLLFLHNYLWENLNLILHVECEEGGYISPLVVNYLSALRYDNGVKWFLRIAILFSWGFARHSLKRS